MKEFLEILNKKNKDEKDLIRLMSDTSKMELFATINKKYKNSIIQKLFCSSMKVQKFQPFQQVFKKDDYGDKFYLIIHGKVNIINKVKGSSFQMSKALEKGQYFGELALINNNKRSATVKVDDVETYLAYIEKQAFGIIFKNVIDEIFLSPFYIINNSFTEHWNKYKKRMFYSSSFIIQIVQEQMLLVQKITQIDGILIILAGEIQMFEIDEKSGEEIDLIVLKQNDIVNDEQFLMNNSPLYSTRCLSQTAQILYINKEDFITKILNDKLTYQKVIKQIENKQGLLKVKLEKIKTNGQFSNYTSQKSFNSDKKNQKQIEEDNNDKYDSPQFQQTNFNQKDDIFQNQDKVLNKKKNNDQEKQFQSVRSTSFFEISFSEDRFHNSHEMPTSTFLKYETQGRESEKQQNFYDLESQSSISNLEQSSQKSSDSSSKQNADNNYFSFKQQNGQQQSTYIQEENQLEDIKEFSDDMRSSENMNLQTISDLEEGQEESYYQQQYQKIFQKQQDLNQLQLQQIQIEQKMQTQMQKIDQDISNQQKLQKYIENNEIKNQFGVQKFEECLQMLNINSNKFEEQFSNFNNQSLLDKQSEQKQNFIEDENTPRKILSEKQQFFGQIIEDSMIFNSISQQKNNEQIDTEDFRNQLSSERQFSLFDVSQEGIGNEFGHEEVSIIQKEQLIQANLTRSRSLIGQMNYGTNINNIQSYQSKYIQKKPTEKHSQNNHYNSPNENMNIMIELNYFDTNQNDNQNIKIIDNEEFEQDEEEEEKIDKFSPLKEKYMKKIKNKQLSSQNLKNYCSSSPMKKSLSNYKKLLSNKLNGLIVGENDKNEKQNEDKILQYQSLQQTDEIPQIQKQISKQENKLTNSYPLFMSPVEQKFTLSTQISPRMSSCQDVGNRVGEEQFNLSQVSSCNGAHLLTNLGVQGLNNAQLSANKENNSQSSQKQQLSEMKNQQVSGDKNKNEILEVTSNLQNEKLNSVLTSSNESQQHEEVYEISQQQITNHFNKKNQIQQCEQQVKQYNQDKQSQQNIKQSQQAQKQINMKRNQIEAPLEQNSFKETIKKQQEILSLQEMETKSIKESKNKIHQNNYSLNNQIEQNNQDRLPIQNIPIHLIKIQEEKAKLTQQQQETFQKYFINNTSKEHIISTSNKLSSQQKSAYQKFLIHTQEAAKTLSNNLNKQQNSKQDYFSNQQEQIKKQQILNNNQSNELNYLKSNIAKLKLTEKKQIHQQNNFSINNILGKSSLEQRVFQKEDNSPITIKNSQSISGLNNLGQGNSNQSKDTQNGIHHRIIKQTAPEIFKKSAEKINFNLRSKSSLITNNNINEKTISFHEMYNLYKNSTNKNVSNVVLSCQNNNNSKINSRAPSLSNLCKSKSQEFYTNHKSINNIINIKGQDIFIKESQIKNSLNKQCSIKNIQSKDDLIKDNIIKNNLTKNKDIQVNDYLIKNILLKDHYCKDSYNRDNNKDHHSKDVSPQSCKQLIRKNSTSIVRRKDVHQGSPFGNTKKNEQIYRSADPSPLRKVSSPQNNIRLNQNYMTQNTNNHTNYNNKDNKNVQNNQYIRRSTNPELSRQRNEKTINMYQTSFESKPKVLLQKDFEDYGQSFKLHQKISSNQYINDYQSHSQDSSLENGILTYLQDTNTIYSNQNPKMYTSLLSSLMSDSQHQQQQSLLEQLQQNRKSSGIQNIKKIIYTQLKESNNKQEDKKNKNIVNILSYLDESKEQNSQSNLIKQIYSKRFSQIN